MNKIRKILLSILSIPMVLSNSVSHATTSIEVIHDGEKVEFDDRKLQEAKDLLNRVNEKFGSTVAKLREVENDLNFYGIKIDDASTYKKVIDVLQKHTTLDCQSIDYIRNWVGTDFGHSEVDFVAAKCTLGSTVYDYIKAIEKLKKLKEESYKLNSEKEKEEKKLEIKKAESNIWEKYGRCNEFDNLNAMRNCMTLITEIGKSNGAVPVLKSCRDLRGTNAKGTLLGLKCILRDHFGNNSNLCVDTLLPKLNRAVELKSENDRYNKALKHDLNYWYNDQWRWIKRFGNFITFADTTDEGKANRAIDNYIEEMKIALGEEIASSNVGTCLFLGTAIIGGAVYCLYESVDGEVVCVPKKSAQNYEQDNEYDDDDYDYDE